MVGCERVVVSFATATNPTCFRTLAKFACTSLVVPFVKLAWFPRAGFQLFETHRLVLLFAFIASGSRSEFPAPQARTRYGHYFVLIDGILLALTPSTIVRFIIGCVSSVGP